ncbi:MAG: hypothetical protein SX243_15825 [Acidobacteriota bacterium]|nr:hypothetical protein [Acidobacteriota bacterium]
MSVEETIRQSMSEIPKVVATGMVDMGSGLMLAIKTIDSHPQSVLDLLAPATKEMFEGEMVLTIEDLFKQARGVQSNQHYFQEILISSTHLWHYFGRLKSDPQVVLCAVCRGDVNLGLLVMKARQIADSATV